MCARLDRVGEAIQATELQTAVQTVPQRFGDLTFGIALVSAALSPLSYILLYAFPGFPYYVLYRVVRKFLTLQNF